MDMYFRIHPARKEGPQSLARRVTSVTPCLRFGFIGLIFEMINAR